MHQQMMMMQQQMQVSPPGIYGGEVMAAVQCNSSPCVWRSSIGWLLAVVEASCQPPVLCLHVCACSFCPPSLCSLLLLLDQMQQQQMGMNCMGMPDDECSSSSGES